MDNARGKIHAENALLKIHQEMKGQSKFRFKKIGFRKGEWQISSFLGSITIKNLFNVLRFNVINPITRAIQEHIIFDSKDTAVLVIVVNEEYIVLSKQHRPIFSRWYIELVRGWIQNPEDVLDPLRRKIPQLLGDSNQEIEGIGKLSDHKPIIELYKCVEDSGFRNNEKSIIIVNVKTDQPITSAKELQQQLRDRRSPNSLCKPCIFTIKEIDQYLHYLMVHKEKRGLIDCQSIEAWLAYYFYRYPPQL